MLLPNTMATVMFKERNNIPLDLGLFRGNKLIIGFQFNVHGRTWDSRDSRDSRDKDMNATYRGRTYTTEQRQASWYMLLS